MQILFFLSLIKQNQNAIDFSEDKKFLCYKRKLFVVSEKIKKWHDDLNLKRTGEFRNDSDFVNIISSPNEFSDSGPEEEDLDGMDDEPFFEYDGHNTINAKSSKRHFNIKPHKQRSYASNMDVASVTKGMRTINMKKKSSFMANLSVHTSITDSPYLPKT
jgi:hypothetical protein